MDAFYLSCEFRHISGGESARSEIMGLEASTLSAYFEWLPASDFAVFKTISDKPTTSGYGYFDDVWNQKGSDCNPPR